VALGAAIPQPSGWTIEVQQPPSINVWRSDAKADESYAIRVVACELSNDGDSIALVLDVAGKARTVVSGYVESVNLPVKALISIQPPAGARPGSIGDDKEAVSFARSVKEELGKALYRYGVRKTHLFFYGPFGLAVFVGQRQTSVGSVQMYEFVDPTYVPSCSFRT
jgi:hypothetical protein